MIGTGIAITRSGQWRLAVAAALAAALAAPAATAQNASMQELLNRVDRIQRELSTLQRQVYTGGGGTPSAAAPPPVAEGAADNPAVAARNAVRVNQLENEIRTLTGRIERIDHRLGQIEGRLDKLVADIDQRLATLEGRPPRDAASADRAASMQAPPPRNAATSPVAPQQPQTPPGLGAPPRPLGTIPGTLAVDTPKGAPPASPAPSQAAPSGTPQQQYDQALSLMLRKQDFVAAETALKSFISENPTHDLTGNAHYWLGETYYVRKEYQQAAFAFAESFQKFPKGNKAPDSLLKLGMSLAQLDKVKEACTAYSRLLANFPSANDRLKARVRREQKESNCR